MGRSPRHTARKSTGYRRLPDKTKNARDSSEEVRGKRAGGGRAAAGQPPELEDLSKHAVCVSPEMLSELSDAELSALKARLLAGKARVEAELAMLNEELATFDVQLAGVDAVEFVALHQRVLEEAPATSEVCTMPRAATQKQPTDMPRV